MTWQCLSEEIAAEMAVYRLHEERDRPANVSKYEARERERKRLYEIERRKRPETAVYQHAYKRMKLATDPEYRKRALEASKRRHKERYWTDTEYREKSKAKARERKARLRELQRPA